MTVDFKYEVGQKIFFFNPFNNGKIDEAKVIDQRFDGKDKIYLVEISDYRTLHLKERDMSAVKSYSDSFNKFVKPLQDIVCGIMESTLEKHHEIFLPGAKVTIDLQ